MHYARQCGSMTGKGHLGVRDVEHGMQKGRNAILLRGDSTACLKGSHDREKNSMTKIHYAIRPQKRIVAGRQAVTHSLGDPEAAKVVEGSYAERRQ